MTNKEKCEMLKDTIYQLYTKEGRPKTYISKLLQINRGILTAKIKEWDFPQSKSKMHLTPANEKILNENKQFIFSQLGKDNTITNIAKHIGISNDSLIRLFEYDDLLKKEYQSWQERNSKNKKQENKILLKDNLIDNEIWKNILGYENYMVSNFGRVKTLYQNQEIILRTSINPHSKRIQVTLNKDGTSKTFQLSRIVAFSFVDGYDEEHNTVNHKDGNINNNNADNLEWVSQAENNLHAYRVLNRPVVDKKRFIFDKIIYKDKYEFKSIAALSRFIGISETQVRRYLETPEKYNIKLINNCND